MKIAFTKQNLSIEISESENRICVGEGDVEIQMTIEEFKKKMFSSNDKWLSLKSSPPNFKAMYLVYHEDFLVIETNYWSAWWNGNYFQDANRLPYKVSHWRPLMETEKDVSPKICRTVEVYESHESHEEINGHPLRFAETNFAKI